ncbi:restriction endonuclease subunit S [Caldifermentibacillus hisashii]|uniref:restriction endonuclease subunit S n=1 Tax=Caldifermentibacillus hisashii TaxID=996558 RepID=UPI0031FC45C9
MSFNEWREEKLEDVIEFNPSETIKKGKVVKKIGMDKLMPFQRKIEGFVVTKYTSGTKFRNGDTLLARITPCLENGKTAQVSILEEGEVGFGSTEFIVLREKPGISDRNFIYYLSISPKLRDIAIKSMTGTSGRQRAQVDVIKNSIIKLPPIEEQRQIANILSSLDEKIEINNEINKKLEEMAQAIFQHWFVDFEFPNENGEPYKSSGGEMVESELGMIPKGWTITTLSKYGKLQMGLSPKSNTYNEEGIGIPLLNGAADFSGKLITPNKYTTDPKRICKENDLVFCIRATIGNITYADKQYCLGRGVASITPLHETYSEYIYYNLKRKMDELISKATGSVILGLSKPDINEMKMVVPNEGVLLNFHKIVSKFHKTTRNNDIQNLRLSNIRDTLLPKLMSGEIRVPVEEEK